MTQHSRPRTQDSGPRTQDSGPSTPPLRIRLTKSRKGPVLTCTRADGSSTYSLSRHADFFAYHDLMHYAVETTLAHRDSFYGLVSRGWQIPDFNVPGAAKKLDLPLQAAHTEFIVGQLDVVGRLQGYGALARIDPAEFNATLAQSCANAGVAPPPPIAPEQLAKIAALMTDLAARWRALAEDESLKLPFP